jgi:uncharacterized protein (TIGR03437 family)
VKVNGLASAIYYISYISSAQIKFQAPAGITGNAVVQVFVGSVEVISLPYRRRRILPGIFPVIENGPNYAGAFIRTASAE